MSDALVLYVTRDGHSRALALDLGLLLGAEVREIGDLVNRRGLFGWIKSGRQAAMRRATPIRDPGADLKAARTLVLVQPVWASAVCPPVRSWIRAHAKELAGKRVAVLASDFGAPSSVIRAKFESEFRSEIGSLAACEAIPQKEGDSLRRKRLEDFAAVLKRG